jgi:ribose/xylose/arabinose/galactoside ABC-type transport system permease subunit
MNNELITPIEKRRFNWRSWLNTLGPVLALIAVYGIFVLIAPPSFATTRNMEMIARQTTIVGVAALGMTIVIISGGIDLSVGSIVALSTVVIASLLQHTVTSPVKGAIWIIAPATFFGIIIGTLMKRHLQHIGMNPLIAVMGGVAAAAFWSLINGALMAILLQNIGTNPVIAAIWIVAPVTLFGIIIGKLLKRRLQHIGMNPLTVVIGSAVAAAFGSLICGILMAILLQNVRVTPLTAAIGGVAAAAFFGLISGMLITRLRVVPFIVTLGMMLVVRGAAKGIGREQKIDVDPERLKWLEELLATVPKERSWMLLPPGVWIMIFLAIATAALLRYTRFGRHTFAIGSNEETARLCGVAVERVKVLVFTMCGAFAGLAGLMQFSRLTVGDPTVAVGLELNVIAAVVIGGGSLSGGEGSILGTLVGALLMTTIASGCTQMGLPNWVQEIITGAIIVVAVAVDRLRHRRSL